MSEAMHRCRCGHVHAPLHPAPASPDEFPLYYLGHLGQLQQIREMTREEIEAREKKERQMARGKKKKGDL